jgi:histidine ammonia-lyase
MGYFERMILIDGKSLTIEQVVRVARDHTLVDLSDEAIPGICASRTLVEEILATGEPVYGITTGVGELARSVIPVDDAVQLQRNLIRSHAVGVCEPVDEEVARAMILLRANALAKGFSGVREELVRFLLELLNRRVVPFIPSRGSVGASGDLAPLAHLALVVMGEGECLVDGNRVPSQEVLSEVGLEPLTLQPKEGLALINGTQLIAALGCLAVHDADHLIKAAQVASAMSMEALNGTDKVFDEKIHAARPHPGQLRCAANMRKLIAGSQVIASHRDCGKVQDAYTLRCIPQVYGAVMDTIAHAESVLSIEINSANDNPLVFAETREVISGGNFHGEPLAFAMDALGMAIAEIANLSERTVDRLVNPHLSGLPPFLVEGSGLNSGFMIAQYTAASLVSENKVFAHPSSVDSIPTSAGQEDHVSMGTTSARHARMILSNVQHVLAIELLCAAQGMDFCTESPAAGTAAAHACIRERVSHLEHDRLLYPDIEEAHLLLASGQLVRAVEKAIGPLD